MANLCRRRVRVWPFFAGGAHSCMAKRRFSSISHTRPEDIYEVFGVFRRIDIQNRRILVGFSAFFANKPYTIGEILWAFWEFSPISHTKRSLERVRLIRQPTVYLKINKIMYFQDISLLVYSMSTQKGQTSVRRQTLKMQARRAENQGV